MYCNTTKNAVITAGFTSGGAEAKDEAVNTDNESAVKFEAECENFTTLEDGMGECLLSYRDNGSGGGQTQRVGDENWPLDTGASGHFTHDSKNWQCTQN